jgi:acetyltransferase-like isoleucine patch superfamily enzyme
MVKRKTIVLKPRLDQTIITQVAEKLKNKLFTRMKIFKPKPSKVQLTSIEKYYKQYLLVNGKYSLDYCKKLVYTLDVDKKAQKVFISNETFKPIRSNDLNSNDRKTIKLTGVATFHHENESRLILNDQGREINSQKLRTILNEELPEEDSKKPGLKKKLPKIKISPEQEINLLRTKLISRPPDVGEIIKEIFEINQRKIIYTPIYKLKFENIKTGKKAILQINGMTAKTTITTFNNKTISSKSIEKLIKAAHKNLKPIKTKPKKTSPIINPPKDTAKPKKVVASPPPDVKKPEVKIEEEPLEFPAKVAGDVFYVGDKVTAIVGDLEIPSGTTVYETLVVKGNLIIGKNCKILGSIKALGTIVIGANTIIKGNAISNQNISIGPRVIIHGRIVFKKALHSTTSTIKGRNNE